jgi:hypothetical protein
MTSTVLQYPSGEELRRRKSLSSRPTGTVVTTGTGLDERDEPMITLSGSPPTLPIEIDKLYPAEDATKPELIKALQLLAQSISALESAREKMFQHELIASDRETGKFEVLLPELFQCRKIGDGFGALINAIETAFVNQRGKPLAEKQLSALWRIVKELRAHPFITTDIAADRAEELARTGLLVDPTIIGDAFDVER